MNKNITYLSKLERTEGLVLGMVVVDGQDQQRRSTVECCSHDRPEKPAIARQRLEHRQQQH